MAKAILLHNPSAGDGNHKKQQLIKLLESYNYEVRYFSTDLPGWESFAKEEVEKIFVAGGGGTVQKMAKVLLEAEENIRTTPVQVLPFGTANNIASTLGLEVDMNNVVNESNTIGFDTGEITGIGAVNFFIEGIGFGIFPKLVKVMSAKEEKQEVPDDPDEEMKKSLKELMKIVQKYEAREAIIIADGEELTGNYLLVECMNIRYIGPNFELAPNAQTGDGEFELVAVPEAGREKLLKYLLNILEENQRDLPLEDFAHLRKVKNLRIKWQGHDAHVDDEVELDYKAEEVKIKNRQATFKFTIPDK